MTPAIQNQACDVPIRVESHDALDAHRTLAGPHADRLRIRGPSFANLGILPEIVPGHMVADVMAILGSIDFVMGECDR